ncbi:MAG: protein translocase SEC61 complex subunit gamma [Candidatus Hydrothermarchaeaceae archaeon]
MIGEALKNWDRVIKLSRKPRRDEFITISKVTALGMLLVGFIGFIIRMVIQLTGISL